MGEVAHEVSDSAFLWSHALLRGLLCASALRHRTVHTGGEPDGDNGERADDGGLPAKLVLLGRLPDGGKHRGFEMPEPRARPCGMDESGRRHGLLDTKLRRGRGTAGQDDGNGRYRVYDEITITIIK